MNLNPFEHHKETPASEKPAVPSPREMYGAIQQSKDQLPQSPVNSEEQQPGGVENLGVSPQNVEPTPPSNTPESGVDPVVSGQRPLTETAYNTNVFGEPVFPNQPNTDALINEQPATPPVIPPTESGNTGTDAVISEKPAAKTDDKLVGDNVVPSLSHEHVPQTDTIINELPKKAMEVRDKLTKKVQKLMDEKREYESDKAKAESGIERVEADMAQTNIIIDKINKDPDVAKLIELIKSDDSEVAAADKSDKHLDNKSEKTHTEPDKEPSEFL